VLSFAEPKPPNNKATPSAHASSAKDWFSSNSVNLSLRLSLSNNKFEVLSHSRHLHSLTKHIPFGGINFDYFSIPFLKMKY
jgi:hypothetical protein